jgi:hypothetical protein
LGLFALDNLWLVFWWPDNRFRGCSLDNSTGIGASAIIIADNASGFRVPVIAADPDTPGSGFVAIFCTFVGGNYWFCGRSYPADEILFFRRQIVGAAHDSLAAGIGAT